MTPAVVNDVVRHLRRGMQRLDSAASTDAELVEAYVRRRDESAFEALVRRHGAMVLGVCRRVLANHADAEDAFQATFLVLVRKAASIRAPGSVGSWLYGVAHATAMRAKLMNRKRRTRELETASLPKAQATEEAWRALQVMLDAELAGLAEKYRSAIVLCDMEGKTIREAARQLGCPQGTLATRLARGRIALAKRLARHGLSVSAAVLAAALAAGAASAQPSPALVSSTLNATGLFAAGPAAGLVSAKVAALAQGVIQAMLLAKLKIGAVGLLAVAIAGVGIGSMGPGMYAQAPGSSPSAQSLTAGKQVQADDGQAKLLQEIERLRAELERTRLQLLQAKQEIAVFKAEADLARARAEAARLKADADAALRKGIGAPPADDPQERQARETLARWFAQVKDKGGAPPAAASAVSPDGRLLVIGMDKVITGYDAQTGQILFKSIGHKGAITALAFSPDGKTFASGGQDKSVCMWDPATGKQLRAMILPSSVASLRFSPDGKTLTVGEIAVGDERTLRDYDIATGKEIRVTREKQKQP